MASDGWADASWELNLHSRYHVQMNMGSPLYERLPRVGTIAGRIMVLASMALLMTYIVGCASRHYRPSQEALTASTDGYEISVQKNGRIDITLASGAPVFQNAYSMVWLEGEPQPRMLPIDGRMGMRDGFHDRLGQGNSLIYKLNEAELRLQAYPTKPFLTVQSAYVNTGKRPVKVKSLMPWCVGGSYPGGVHLGEGTDQTTLLDNGPMSATGSSGPRLAKGQATSQWSLAGYNPVSGRSLIAGFLTSDHGYTQVSISRSQTAPADRFDHFRAECLYDPPIEVPPGGVLRSEKLYLGVVEAEPVAGLDRYGHAVAVTNEVVREKNRIPHGWDSAAAGSEPVTEESITSAADIAKAKLGEYGWNHITVGKGWQKAVGEWEPDAERFPQGMRWLTDYLHARGLTVGLWLDPFRVNVNTPLAQEHPEWLRPSNEAGKPLLAADERIFDITAPGAYDYIKALYRRVREEWGFDVVVEPVGVSPLLYADGLHDRTVTCVEALRMARQAVREGLGPKGAVVADGPASISGIFAEGVRIGGTSAPVWKKVPDRAPWGAVEALANGARQFYLAPYLCAPDAGAAYFEEPALRERWGMADQPALTTSQSIAWLTGVAMLGGVVTLGNDARDLNEQHVAILSRLLPLPGVTAKPVDLFTSETPRVWTMPLRGAAGDWHLVALFNWDAASEQTILVSMASLGLRPGELYTLYNFWGDTYHGVVSGEFQMSVPPGSVQLLGLRRFENRPMLLASARHFTQGAFDVTDVSWDRGGRCLTGTLDAPPDTECNLRILVPAPYACTKVEVSVLGTPGLELLGQMLKVRFFSGRGGKISWSVHF